MLTSVACGRCGTRSHPDPGTVFFTCYQCNAQLVCRRSLGRGWEVLTPTEMERVRIIDLEWHVEQDRYKVWDRMGMRLPSTAGSIFWAIAGGALGCWIVSQALGAPPGAERDRLLFYGATAIFMTGAYALYSLAKAREHAAAYEAYQQRRLMAVLNPAAEPGATPSIHQENTKVERAPPAAP